VSSSSCATTTSTAEPPEVLASLFLYIDHLGEMPMSLNANLGAPRKLLDFSCGTVFVKVKKQSPRLELELIEQVVR
jgi:hypothetical protein